jgi:PAS domain S-box-containing protein
MQRWSVFTPMTAGAVAIRLPPARRALVLALCALSGLFALVALAGWLSQSLLLARWLADLPTMKVNTALSVLCLSAALPHLGAASGHRLARIVAWLPAAVVVLMGATMIEHLVGIDLGVDRTLMVGAAPSNGSIGRTAEAAALALLLMALAALPVPTQGRRWRSAAVVTAFVIGYVASVGLMLEVSWTRGAGAAFADVSLPTAACVVMLSATEWSMLQWQASEQGGELTDSPGARFLRAAMPVAAVLPASVMWLQHLAQLRGWWDERAGIALAVALLALVLWVLALRSARWIDALESELRSYHRLLEKRVDERTAELKDSAATLRASQTQLSAVVESASTAIITLDSHFRVVVFNHEAERVFGVQATDMIGQTLDRLLPERSRPAHAEALRRFAGTGETLRRMGGEYQLHGLRADGREFPIAASISRVMLPQGALLTVVLRDLTDTLELERERAARHAAELASRSKSMLLSHVSHELRTPLNAVLGFTQLLRRNGDVHSESARSTYLHQIEIASRQLDALISDLLDLSRAEVGAFALDMKPLNPAGILREATDMMSSLAQLRRITFDVEMSPLAMHVVADRRRLLQVMNNLLSNAVKYSPADGRVRALLREDGSDVALEVIDSGDGLTDEQLAHLFEPFNRLGRERGPIQGTGIGLALCRHLVLAMNGRIEVSSRPGSGSRFIVRLPRARS